MKVGIIGAGRIGVVHAENIVRFIPSMELKTIAEIRMTDEIRAWATKLGVPNVVEDPKEIFNDPEIDAVLICSSTDTHSKFIIEAARAKKNIFCEKPIDHDIAKIHEALDEVEKSGVKMQIGFGRRFDHNHRKLYDVVRSGAIGEPHIIKISSRDTVPAPIEYLARSGGIFYDMMIHDFDMARFYAGSEVTEVYAQASVLIDPRIGEIGDVDTAVVTLKFESGAIAVIDNSRKAVYGYDQRIEVFGSKGYAADDNDTNNRVYVVTENQTISDTPIKGMWDRYMEAFIEELRVFADSLENNKEIQIPPKEGLYPVLIAEAATRSAKQGRPVKMTEIS
jgi:myo-inositol 2-dehydrogenase/D-chiro-inositol 1-dehydrogenase